MSISRRLFTARLGAIVAAPAVVRADALMPLRGTPQEIMVRWSSRATGPKPRGKEWSTTVDGFRYLFLPDPRHRQDLVIHGFWTKPRPTHPHYRTVEDLKQWGKLFMEAHHDRAARPLGDGWEFSAA